MLRLLRLVIKARVFFLQVPGVGKNNFAQINRRLCRVNLPAKSPLHQSRDPAAVVEMRVGQHDRVNLLRRDRRIAPVALAPLLWPLKQSAVDENLKSALARRIASVDEMFRPSNRTRSTQKLNVGQIFLPGNSTKKPTTETQRHREKKEKREQKRRRSRTILTESDATLYSSSGFPVFLRVPCGERFLFVAGFNLERIVRHVLLRNATIVHDDLRRSRRRLHAHHALTFRPHFHPLRNLSPRELDREWHFRSCRSQIIHRHGHHEGIRRGLLRER